MKTLSIEALKVAFTKLGYTWSKTLPNLIGIRTTLNLPNVFNDVFVCVWTQPAMPEKLSVGEQQAFLNRFGYVGANGKPLVEDGKPGGNTSFALAALLADTGATVTAIDKVKGPLAIGAGATATQTVEKKGFWATVAGALSWWWLLIPVGYVAWRVYRSTIPFA